VKFEQGHIVGLSTDLYELTMAASYAALEMEGEATFSLFTRSLPPNRSFLVVAGLEEALQRLQDLRFDSEAIEFLRSIKQIGPELIDRLDALRFTGDVWAVPEGRAVFANEPFLEVRAPIIEAQLVETMLVNALHFSSLVATKAARCVLAAPGKAVIDFGLRRTPSIDAGLAAARASYLAGFVSTSNVLAGERYGIPVAGTLAHSYVEAFSSELEAFRAFSATFPGPVTLLIDTYDTLQGAAHAIQVAHELEAGGGRLLAVRIDSGDLASLSKQVRDQLDAAGLTNVQIIGSGGLDEFQLEELTIAAAPIDAYGVGTKMGTSSDAPMLDMAYKLVEYDGTPRLKLSTDKVSLVGPKQVWRRYDQSGCMQEDLIATRDEEPPDEGWEPMLRPVMVEGRPIPLPSLDDIRSLHRREMESLPEVLLSLEDPGRYPVGVSERLMAEQARTSAAIRRQENLI
jgi:nicotinate phosphoribosyltransferase